MNLPQHNAQNALAKLFSPETLPDTVSAWAELYFRIEVTTSPRSRKEQQRDLQLFIDFLFRTAGQEDRLVWTPRLSRAFLEHLQQETREVQRRWSDRTINRVLAHLKTFAKWVHQHRPFPLGNPMAKLGLLKLSGGLDVERALTEAERRQLLDAADYLPVTGGRSKDRRRHGNRAATERPQRQGYRPWRNRAILYTLVETGMRRAAVASIDLADVDFQRNTVRIIQKGGQQRRCMGVSIIKKTGNPRAVQRQLGHTNPSTSMQYMQFTQAELQAVLDER